MSKKGRPPGTKNKPGHKAGAVKKEPTVRMSIPLSLVSKVSEMITIHQLQSYPITVNYVKS